MDRNTMVRYIDLSGDEGIAFFQGYSTVNKYPYVCTAIMVGLDGEVRFRNGGLFKVKEVYPIKLEDIGHVSDVEYLTLEPTDG